MLKRCGWRMAAGIILAAASARAELDDLTLNDLLAPRVAVATKKALSSRETPSVVTVVTHEEIAASGARDLLDVLRFVPGFTVATDVQGVTSLGVRGLWAQEGKVLLMVDGQEMNEIFYSGLALGGHIPLEQVRQIEIIRGPGSVLYGGTAELAVINVLTKADPGAEASAAYGRLDNTQSRAALSAFHGAPMGAGTATLGLHASRGLVSDGTYVDAAGTDVPLTGASARRSLYANAAYQSSSWQARILMDLFHTRQQDQFDTALPGPARTDFDNYFAEVRRVFRPADGWTLTPYLKTKRQVPWRMYRDEDYWYKIGDRITAGATATRETGPATLTLGGEYFEDRGRTGEARPDDPFTDNLFAGGRESVRYSNAAGYFEGLFQGWAVATVGGRYERNSRFGSVFVPRLGLTKAWRRLHLKALYSKAYRAPAIMNLDLNPDIRPEKTRSMEAEVGWRWSDAMLTTLNVFDVRILDPIVYTVIAGNETYVSAERTGSRGLEATHTIKTAAGSSLSLAYAQQKPHKNTVSNYAVPGRDDLLLGMPAHRFTAAAAWRGPGAWTLAPSWEWMGRRRAYAFDPDLGAMALRTLGAESLVHLAATRRNLAPGLDATVSVHNVFNETVFLPQPYDGGHPPLLGPGREWNLRLTYTLKP